MITTHRGGYMDRKIMLAFFTLLIVGCTQPGEVFVPTDVIPIDEGITGEVISEPPEDEEVLVEENVPEEVVSTTVVVEEEVSEPSSGPVIEVTEGDLVELQLTATDPDGDIITYTFEEPLDDTGTWQTEAGDAGEYQSTVVVSDGETDVTQVITIRVLSSNKAPVISIGDVQVKEGEVIELAPAVTDPDGDEVTITYSGFMDSANASDNV